MGGEGMWRDIIWNGGVERMNFFGEKMVATTRIELHHSTFANC